VKQETLTLEELARRIGELPRVRLGELPTPLQELPRLSKALGGPRIFMKRDDLTGLAFGGNKTRMFEFLLADALKAGADTVVGGAGVQSNYCRQLAAACNVLGLEVHLVLREMVEGEGKEIQGNLLLDLLAGATVHLLQATADQQRKAMYELAEELRRKGCKPYVVRMANNQDLSFDIASYVNCFCEIARQCGELAVRPTHLYVCSYDSTQSGLELGRIALGSDLKIVGVTPETRPERSVDLIARYCGQTARRLGIACSLRPEQVSSSGEYIGRGYGIPSPEGIEAIKTVARTEGIFLDPVYSGKAMACLFDHARRGLLGSRDVVVFLHTGGTPALFACADQLVSEELKRQIVRRGSG
jgi:1-aminocyclopropane-1-carboxylate deaminase/D-cysteine desulfhydrase-like pyridoxal-dependent ACC family enzyme